MLYVDPSEYIASVKSRIQEIEGIPSEQFRLSTLSQAMQDDRTVSDYNIQNFHTVQILLRHGGQYL